MVKYIGYHGNTTRCRKSIEEHGLDPDLTHKRTDHWLGNGVYFYENQEQAIWWANTVLRTVDINKGYDPLVYKAEICSKKENFLDLDDYNDLSKFKNALYKDYDKIKAALRKRFPNREVEDKQFRAIYFDYYKKNYNIHVIVYSFDKESVPYGMASERIDRNKDRKLASILQLPYREKQICVSHKECISNLQLVYDGESEVI